MVFLFVYLMGFSCLITTAFEICSYGVGFFRSATDSIDSTSGRVRAWSLYAFVTVACSIPIVLALLSIPYDFRKVGDGGFGMAVNALVKTATVILVPAIVWVQVCWFAKQRARSGFSKDRRNRLAYFLTLHAQPGEFIPADAIQTIQQVVQSRTGPAEIIAPGSPDAGDAESLALEIDSGHLSESEYTDFCERNDLAELMPDGNYNHTAARWYLDFKQGQKLLTCILFPDPATADAYAELVNYARGSGYRLRCPMRHVLAEINLDHPGKYPPRWDDDPV